MSDYANEQNKINHSYAKITHEDFIDCIKQWDSKDTFFLIDPPWFDREYNSNSLAYCDMKANEYYKILSKILPTLKGNWFVLSKAHNPPTKLWSYPKTLVESEKNVLFGKKAKTLITSKSALQY